MCTGLQRVKKNITVFCIEQNRPKVHGGTVIDLLIIPEKRAKTLEDVPQFPCARMHHFYLLYIVLVKKKKKKSKKEENSRLIVQYCAIMSHYYFLIERE